MCAVIKRYHRTLYLFYFLNETTPTTGASYTREAARIFFQRTCESILSTKEEARKKKKKEKKEVQEEETDERSRWGVGAGTGQKVYGSLTLVFSRLCFCSHQHKHAKCEAVFHP